MDSGDQNQIQNPGSGGKKPSKKPKKKKPKYSLCPICLADIDNLSEEMFYPGHPDQAVVETVAITDPKVNLDTEGIEDDDCLPSYRLTNFTFYDDNNHMVALDSDVMERSKDLYVSGYLKNVTNFDPLVDENAIPVKDIGPLVAWWSTGLTKGDTPSYRGDFRIL